MKVMAGRRGGRRGREVEGMSGTSNRLRRVQLQIEKELRKRIYQWSKQKLKLSKTPPPPPHLQDINHSCAESRVVTALAGVGESFDG